MTTYRHACRIFPVQTCLAEARQIGGEEEWVTPASCTHATEAEDSLAADHGECTLGVSIR